MKFLADLERLDAAATPGPWCAGLTYADERQFDIDGKYDLGAVMMVDGPLLFTTTRFTAPGAVRDEAVMLNNRDLVVLLRNACPALVALVRAAEGAVHTISTSVPVDAPFSHLLNRDVAELRAAIADLGGAK